MAGNGFYIAERNEDGHDKHSIKKGDTFESVAEELGIEWQTLRAYHNTHCVADADVINAYFPSHLKFLLLKPIRLQANGELEEEPLKKVIFNNSFRIPFNRAKVKKNYVVMYTMENGEQVNTIKYKASVNWVATDKNEYSFFEIDRQSNLCINDKEADTIAEKLSEQISSILYPLVIVVDQTGKWIDIHNFKIIQERWRTRKQNILGNNEGMTINKYLDFVDSMLVEKDNLLKNLLDDWFLTVLFNGIHTDHTSDLAFTTTVDFPIIPKEVPVKFEIIQKIEEYLNSANMLVIKRKGILADIANDIASTENPQLGNYYAIYHLNPNNYMIENVSLVCNIMLDNPKKVTIEIHNLNDSKVIVGGVSKSLFVAEEVKKESFLKGLFKHF
ncbi:hypothetical protein OIU83_19125 [Flavobacterium sp. LS1R49]|uniref:LysM domain-containing protein n=1 Tax=Flavobacterium shii TaxID=2987687 RepID=A0A9X2ZHC5_9FLAO|nr:hypothetical protein [Flavobacterium shii]MCV9929782.1 hypothetical protein [Flavobacterium shii]